MTNPIKIGNRIEMFVDEYLVDNKKDIRLKLNRPERREVVLTYDRPWESLHGSTGVCVFHDNGKYRMYYRATFPENIDDHSPGQACAYAESKDGIHWDKPDMDYVQYHEHKKTNLLLQGRMCHNFAPFRDTNPNCSQDSFYKAICGHAPEGLFAYKSADGYRWSLLSPEPVLTKGAFDTMNFAFFDANKGKYISYTRYFDQTEHTFDLSLGIRAIQNSLSCDFLHWSDPVPNLYSACTPREHLYTNAATLCPGAEHMYFSFPMRYMHERHKIKEHPYVGISDSVIMTSRDGLHWDRPFLESWVPAGLNQHCWTQRSLTTLRGILKTGNEFSMYVSENYMWDDMCIRRVTVPLYRFASMHAPRSGGTFTTKPFIFEGSHLSINYSTGAPGFIKAGITDEDGLLINNYSIHDCDIIYGDELEKTVTWHGDGALSFLDGKTVRLVFELSDADIYALQIK